MLVNKLIRILGEEVEDLKSFSQGEILIRLYSLEAEMSRIKEICSIDPSYLTINKNIIDVIANQLESMACAFTIQKAKDPSMQLKIPSEFRTKEYNKVKHELVTKNDVNQTKELVDLMKLKSTKKQ